MEEESKPLPKYHSVNSQWPDGTDDGRDLKPTAQEAMSAAKRLYRFAMKRPFRGKMKLTSGRRYSWIRNHVFYVNPDCRNDGWHELVHDLSHCFCQKLFPRAKGHGPQHAFLEKEMIQYVVSSGWLDGKLKPKPRQSKPKPSEHDKTLAALKRWETKRKRAETAIRKLNRRAKYYERKAA